jgi:hypothetical protein
MVKLNEDVLEFEFDKFNLAEYFDVKETNPEGLKSVDFIAENNDTIFFIEVKDYQNPNATEERKTEDIDMLKAVIRDKAKKSTFVLDVGQKIKDSLLRQYALEKAPNKPIIYLLFLNLDKLSESERGKLREKLIGCIPTGLNDSKYSGFTSIAFRIVNSEQLKEHGIICTPKAD